MNRTKARSWEMRLGLPQVVVLLGVLTGTMACAFGIGYVTGQTVGFENALTSSISALPKYPIEDSTIAELDVDDVQEVYEDIEGQPLEGQTLDTMPLELPELGAVKSAKNEPVVDDLVVDLLNEEVPEKNTAVRGSEASASAVVQDSDIAIRILGDGDLSVTKSATLGSLTAKKVEKDTAFVSGQTNKIVASKEIKIGEVSKTSGAEDTAISKLAKIKEEASKEIVAPVIDKKIQEVKIENPELVKKQDASSLPTTSDFLQVKLTRGWYVQVAAPQSVSDANSLSSRLRGSGFPVVIEQADVRGDTYYRVLVGPEDNRQQGEILLEQVKRERYLKGQPFVRMVK